MLKQTIVKMAVFLMLCAIVFLPGFLSDAASILPIMAIFWLDGVVQTMGAEVSVNGGVDTGE